MVGIGVVHTDVEDMLIVVVLFVAVVVLSVVVVDFLAVAL